MPRISEFYGIAIEIYFGDHSPPHFHAIYGEDEALVEIDPIRLTKGHLPARGTRLVLEWASEHQEELVDNWGRVQRFEPPFRIPGLP